MKIAIISTDTREHISRYDLEGPIIPTPQAALLEGFANSPDAEVILLSCFQKIVKSEIQITNNIQFISVHAPKWGWLRSGYFGCINAVRHKLRELNPDVVHGQGTERDCAISAVFSGFPSVLTIHGNMAELARLHRAPIGSFYWLQARLENIALRKADGVFCNSGYTESLVAPRARRCWRVPNAIRREFFNMPQKRPPNAVPIILNVGVVSPRKRQLEILSVARDLYSSGAKVEWHFVGSLDPSDQYARSFECEIKKAQQHGYAKFFEHMSTAELITKMDDSDALVHFPYEEAFGLVVAEAMARGLKIFGSDLGGIRDICSGIDDSALIADGDYKMLGAAIRSWLLEDAGHKRLDQMKIIKSRYAPEVVAQKHIDIYREVLAARE